MRTNAEHNKRLGTSCPSWCAPIRVHPWPTEISSDASVTGVGNAKRSHESNRRWSGSFRGQPQRRGQMAPRRKFIRARPDLPPRKVPALT
jgi:hypothetical protein